MYRVKLEEAENQLLALINAALSGEKVVIYRDEQQSVTLVPDTTPKRQAKFGSAKGLIKMTEDFDAPLNDFEDYMS
jgi:antitoxin (DNA-binding transcriptional repressor) of toxin-antitoxin stability system